MAWPCGRPCRRRTAGDLSYLKVPPTLLSVMFPLLNGCAACIGRFIPLPTLYPVGTMTDPMRDIMQQDATIDDTPDFGIMTGWVKAKVWETYRDAVGPRRALEHDLGEQLEEALETGAPQAMRPVLVRLATKGWFSGFVHDLPHDESITFELWDKLTKDDMSHEEKIENARKWYKNQLSGCIGVQPSGILRANLKDYHEADADDLPDYSVYRGDFK